MAYGNVEFDKESWSGYDLDLLCPRSGKNSETTKSICETCVFITLVRTGVGGAAR